MSYGDAYSGAYNGARDYQRDKDRFEWVTMQIEEISRMKVDRDFEKAEREHDFKLAEYKRYEEHKPKLEKISLDDKFNYLSEYMKFYIDKLIAKEYFIIEFDQWLTKKLYYPDTFLHEGLEMPLPMIPDFFPYYK